MDMKLEVVLVPVSDVDRAKASMSRWGGGSTPTSRSVTTSGSCSSRRPARHARSSSGAASRPPRRAPCRVCSSSSTDIAAARAELAGNGVDVSEVFHDATGVFHHAGTEGAGSRTRPGECQLWLVCILQRPGRQRLAAPRGDAAPARTVTGRELLTRR